MLILIDGISGSGKTTFAHRLGELLHVDVLHLDDWYPGWSGLAEGSRITEEIVTGARTSYPLWDWTLNRPSGERAIATTDNLIIEGCGAITTVSAPYANLSIWLDAPPNLARQRAAQREGKEDIDWWEGWNRQERAHWARHSPRELATLVIQVGA